MKQIIASASNPSRIHAMDSLRGLASLQVLIHHALGMSILFLGLSEKHWVSKLFTYSPLHIVWAGHEAVIFFFVMSGFVLSIPYYKNRGGSYPSFFIKRIFRIYFPYLIAICIGLILNSIFVGHNPMKELSPWVNSIFTKKFNSGEIISFIFSMKGDFPKLVTSLWSLPVEIKISLVLPFVFIPVKKLNIPVTMALPILNMAFYHIGKKLGFQDAWNDFSLFYYFSFFLFGAALSKYLHLLLPIFNKLNNASIILLLFVTLLMYTYTWNIVWLPYSVYNLFDRVPTDYVVGVAALLLIVISATNKVGKLLTHRYMEELGKISFSLYLIHPIVIAVIAILLGNMLPVYILIMISILLSVIVSFPFHYWIEWPLQKLGRNLGDKLSKKQTLSPGVERVL